jgi:hypothetical protein
MEGGAVGHNIERGPPNDHPSQICFNLHSKWLLLLKIDISLVVNFCFITNQNELKTSKVDGGVTHNFESGPPKDHFNSISEQKILM